MRQYSGRLVGQPLSGVHDVRFHTDLTLNVVAVLYFDGLPGPIRHVLPPEHPPMLIPSIAHGGREMIVSLVMKNPDKLRRIGLTIGGNCVFF